jgi:AcrR family transcriptional regulator
MASASPARLPSLHSDDWIKAGFARLSEVGIEGVRVELLARDVHATKGSFYWHFRDRNDLLERMLARWESDELGSLDFGDGDASPASRWARFVQNTANPRRVRTEAAIRAWARVDEHVERRVAVVESRKAIFIASVLQHVGFIPSAAEAWAETVWLMCLGWLDRAARRSEVSGKDRSLDEFLSEMILAASAGSPEVQRRRT